MAKTEQAPPADRPAPKAKAPAFRKYRIGPRPHYRKGVYYPAHTVIELPADEAPAVGWKPFVPPVLEDKGETPDASPPEA